MNHQQMISLCDLFKLGTPLNSPKRIHGGLLHTMWRINTDEGSYAIKQLSPHINLANEAIIKNYNLTESIASCFIEHGIPGVSAIEHTDNYLEIIDGIGFLIYPWVNAEPLHKDSVSEIHALKIANILAKMHLINLVVPEITEFEFDIHSNDKLIELIQKANLCNCPFANELTALQQDIISINTSFQNSLPALKNHIVISHGDLDQKNVLWDNNRPILIDWECVRKLNPTHEIVDASLNWSGITTHFDEGLFIKMMHTYTTSGGHLNKDLLQAAFNAVQGNWINWMVYNIERSCVMQESEQQTMGIEQVNQVLKTIVNLKNIVPNLMITL
ncbi:TPA: aminoglycoside phosphotransferase family protein [Legionella pneumophila]|nr:aminoglycoside phosphotransferase family protein [Legionella pneumophila]